FGDPSAPVFLDLLDQIEIDPALVDHIAARIRAGHDLAAQFLNLLNGVDRHIARTGHDHTAAVEILTPGLEHFGNEIDGAIAGGFLAHARAAPGQTLAGQNARFIAVGHALVLAEHIADLALADADVTGGNIGIFTDVAAELDHV